jgi:urease accessory protein
VTRSALTAAARLDVRPGPGRQRLTWNQAWPVVLRPTGDDRVHLVHGAGGPLGGDEFALHVEVAAGAGLRVRSAGVTLVQPAGARPAPDPPAPARWTVTADVGAGAWLDWAPEATVVCTDADLDSRLRVRVDGSATALVRELVVLGRHGERGGRYRGELTVEVGGLPLLAHTTLLDGADPVVCGPGGSAGARAVGTLVLAGGEPGAGPGTPAGDLLAADEAPGVRWARTALDGPGQILIAVGDPGPVTAVLDACAAAWADRLSPRPTTSRPDPEPIPV